jgi:hypothetical protein
MSEATRLKSLKIVLVVVGLTFIGGIYLLMMVWPSGWTWHTGHSDYPLMIVGVYATLGVFLLMAVRDPEKNRNLIQFTIWSSVVHAAIMLVQSFGAGNHGHLTGDVPALFVVAGVLAALLPRRGAATAARLTA